MGDKKDIMKKIKTALISLFDKSNLKPLLQELKKNNIKIISSGGTFSGAPEYSGDTCFNGSVNWTHHPHLRGETLTILGNVTVADCNGSFVTRSGKIQATGAINLNCGGTSIVTTVEQCNE